jgi:hypothetical protein
MESIRVRAESVTPCRLLPRALAATLLLSLSALALPSAAQEAPAPRPATAALEALEEARSLGKLGGVAYDQLLQHMAGQSRIRVIVQFEDQNDPDAGLTGPQARTATAFNARKAAITRLYQRLTSRLQTLGIGPAKPFSNIPFMSLELNADELSTLAQQPEVASIHIDEQMHLSLFDTVPQIGADSAWLDGYTGNGQVIAVLDAGRRHQLHGYARLRPRHARGRHRREQRRDLPRHRAGRGHPAHPGLLTAQRSLRVRLRALLPGGVQLRHHPRAGARVRAPRYP